MNITRKDILLFVIRLIPLVSIIFLFTDMMGILFVGDDYTVRVWLRFKVLFFLTIFAVVFLVGGHILKWPLRQLAYIGYPLYLLVMVLCGIFTAPHDLLGYKIGLGITPCLAQLVCWYGKGWMRRYLRMVTNVTGGRL
jgi:hypothetical protein